jgi:hypothetical protein
LLNNYNLKLKGELERTCSSGVGAIILYKLIKLIITDEEQKKQAK